MGDLAFCSMFVKDYQIFRNKLESGTLTEEELIEFDKRYGCRLEWFYQSEQVSEYSRPLFRPKKNIYSNPIIKRW